MSDEGAPAWMVSFGDMMTLILTFFILLVSMGKTQQVGLAASGVGSFLVAVRSFGLPGVLDEHEKASMFDNVRERFSLPPEDDPERREEHINASQRELIRASLAQSLEPHDQVSQPSLAVFDVDSATLTQASARYIDLLAASFRPAGGQSLLLEGHAIDAGRRYKGENTLLAFERASAVRDYLIEEHGFPPTRVVARAWLVEINESGPGTRSVDARLIIPARNE